MLLILHRIGIFLKKLSWMERGFLSKQKIVALFFALGVGAALFVLPGFVSFAKAVEENISGAVLQGAGELSDAILGPLFAPTTLILYAVSYIIMLLGAGAMNFAVVVIDTVLNVTDITNVAIVNVGWRVSLDFVNLLFILILLVIGFATIFRQETYGLKALLPRLIIVALLINFSKVIAGVIIDVGNLLTSFFLHPGGTERIPLGDAIMKLLNAYKLFAPSKDFWDTVTDTAKAVFSVSTQVKFIFSSLMGAMLMWIAAIGLLLASLTFIVRIVMLWLLIIFAPFAWIAWILPGTRQYAQMWWSNFLKWVFVAPIMVFFFYLLAAYAQEINSLGISPFTGSVADSPIAKTISGVSANLFLASVKYIIQYAIVMAFIFAGPWAAQSIGGMAASGVIGIAGAGQRWAMGAMSRGAAKGALAPVKYTADRAKERAAPYAEKAGNWLANSPLAKLPGMGALSRGMMGAGEQNRAAIAEAMKKYASLSTGTLANTAGTIDSANITDRMAIATLLAQRRDLNEQTPENQKKAKEEIKSAINVGRATYDYETIKPLLAAMPHLGVTDEEKQKGVREARRTGTMENISEESLKDKIVVEAIEKELGETPQAMYRFGEKLGEKSREALITGLAAKFTTGNTAEDFNASNTNSREAFLMLRPEKFLEGITDSSGAVKKDFGKSIAIGMKDENLERFISYNATTIDPVTKNKVLTSDAVDRYKKFEELRGTIHIQETDRAFDKSGIHDLYEQNLKARLDADRTAAIAANDANVYYNDNNAKRMGIYTMASGNTEPFNNSGAGADKNGLDWQKESGEAKRSFFSTLKNEDMETLGRKSNKHPTARKEVAEAARISQLSYFLENIDQKERINTFKDAYNKNSKNKAWLYQAGRDEYMQYLAAQCGIKLPVPKNP
ncbi:MAG: hypothetical protein Q7S09_05765 [bacterium]|nr:hypothetical protein [bacterium]